MILLYFHPRTQQLLQKSVSHYTCPNPSFTGFWCRTSWHATSWHHSSKEATVTTSPIVQLKFETFSPALPQSLLIRQFVAQQCHHFAPAKRLMLLHHPMNISLSFVRVSQNENTFLWPLTPTYLQENIELHLWWLPVFSPNLSYSYYGLCFTGLPFLYLCFFSPFHFLFSPLWSLILFDLIILFSM